MPKLKTDAITAEDIDSFTGEMNGDFEFEMKVLHELNSKFGGSYDPVKRVTLQIEHKGTYVDPVTSRPREFDLRARFTVFQRYVLRFAIECKNIGQNFPLLISRVPRQPSEDVVDYVFSFEDLPCAVGTTMRAFYSGSHVGKDCKQIGRLEHGNSFTATDAGVYDKWAQALSSSVDLFELSLCDAERVGVSGAVSLVLPMVVVPDGMLWVADYDDTGGRIDAPKQVDQCEFYVSHPICAPNEAASPGMTVSYLEFVTLKGLLERLYELTDQIDITFPDSYLRRVINADQWGRLMRY